MEPVNLDHKKILVISYGHLADTMAAVPAIRSLRAAFPDSTIHVLALDSARPILEPCPYIDRLITWSDFQHKGTRLARAEKLARVAMLGLQLKKNRYDATLVFHRSAGAMRRLATVIGSPIRAGVDYGGDAYTHPAPPDSGTGSSRAENRRVLGALRVPEDGGSVEIWTQASDAAMAEDTLAGQPRPLIGLHPGSDWSCQQWHPRAFAEVGRKLQAAMSAGIVITGAAGETDLEAEIVAGMPRPPLRACGRTTFGQFVEVVRRLDLLICVNSAAAAVARTVGTPAVVLLGLEDAGYTEAFDGDRIKVIQPHQQVTGGSWCEFGRWGVLSGCNSPICRGLGGLATLDPQVVAQSAIELLEKQGRGTRAQASGTNSAPVHQVPIGPVKANP